MPRKVRAINNCGYPTNLSECFLGVIPLTLASVLAVPYRIADLRDTLSEAQSDPNLVYDIIWELGSHLCFVIVE